MNLADKAFSEWYTLAAAVGGAIILASLVAAHNDLLIVGLGLTLLGIGEFINHPVQTVIKYDALNRTEGVYSGRPRRNKPFGWLLAVAGFSLLALGLYRIVVT